MFLFFVTFFTFLSFMLGASFASFGGVVWERGRKGESILGRSECVCGRPLKPWENIPVFGWLFSGGKARCCGSKIPSWYFWSELTVGLLFAIITLIILLSTFTNIPQ